MVRNCMFGMAAMAAAMAAAPAAAANGFGWAEGAERHRAAFAGATLRLALGGPEASAPDAQLGIGFVDYRRASEGAWAGGRRAEFPIAAGLRDGRVRLLAGGETLPETRRRLGLADDGSTALLVLGGLAAGALAIVLLTGDDEDGPCPPGVEVCIQ